MAIEVRTLDEAKVLAQAVKDGRVPESQRAEAMRALRNFRDGGGEPTLLGAVTQSLAGAVPFVGERLQESERRSGTGERFARGAASGAADIVDMAATPLTAAAYGVGRATGLVDEDQRFFGDEGFADLSGAVRRGLGGDTSEPLSGAESAGRVGGNLVGGFGVSGALKALGRLPRLANFLGNSKGAQTIAAASGETARQVAEDAGAGTGGQLAASLVGSLSPVGIRLATYRALAGAGRTTGPRAAAALRETVDDELAAADDVMRSYDRIKRLEAVGLIDEAPALPRGGQAAVANATSSQLQRAPKKIIENSAKQVDALAQLHSQRLAKEAGLAEVPSRVKAGQLVSKSLEKFADRFKAKSSALYNAADSMIDPKSSVAMPNTARAVEELGAGSNPLATAFRGEGMDRVARALQTLQVDDVGNPVMRYAALREARSALGKKLGTFELVSDIDRGQLKQLYGAITRDMETHIGNVSPDALRAAQRANRYYAAGRQRMDDALSFVTDKLKDKGVDPKRVVNAIESEAPDAPELLRNLRKTVLQTEGGAKTWKALQSNMLSRMGQSTPGQQNAAGNAFSLETFLTNYNKVKGTSRDVMFGGKNAELRQQIDRLARIAEKSRLARQEARGSITFAQLTWDVVRNTSSAALGRLMSRPAFVRAVADTVERGVAGNAPGTAFIANLSSLAKENPEWAEDIADVIGLIDIASEAQTSER